jgi:porin
MNIRHVIGALALGLAATQPAWAGPEVDSHARDGASGPQGMLSSMDKYREQLADAGVEFSLTYDGDLWGVASGGLKRRVTYLDFIELRITLDNEKLFGLKGNTVSVSLIDSNGTTTNASTVGSTQGIDNSEVSGRGVRLYEAWTQQNFLDDRISILLGVHDLNTEFAATTISDNFLTPTFQIGQSFAQSGEGGPSVFPNTALAARLKVKPTEDSYAAFTVYDGVAGTPGSRTGSGIRLNKKDGALLVGELAYVPPAADSDAELNKLAVGVWNYTSGLDDLNDVDSNGNPARTVCMVG